MSIIDDSFLAISNFRLWVNNQTGTPLLISDVPEIIPLRWTYFRDNWDFIKPDLIAAIPGYVFPDLLKATITAFSSLIDSQRASLNKKFNPFSNRDAFKTYFSIFDNILINNIALTKQESDLITNKVNVINNYTKKDFVAIRDTLRMGRDNIADTVGGSDPDYNRVYQRSSTSQLRDIALTDVAEMNIIQQSIDSVEAVLANIFNLSTVTVDPFALARSNANNPDYFVQLNTSGFLVRMQYGDSLQTLADRFLGTADRWIEIAIANGLKAPYVDEVGQEIPLISNGSKNQINIAGTDPQGNSNLDKIYVNQVVFLRSIVEVFPSQRTIIDIKTIPVSGEIVITLNGDLNLDLYKTAEGAVLKVFKPNTINSGFFVMIPSTTPLPNDVKSDTPWFLSTKSEDEKISKVDLLINDNGDLVFGNNGDLQLSFGLGNAMQAMKLKISIEQGSLSRHPTFGLTSVVGTATRRKSTARQTITDSIIAGVAADPRFAGVQSIDVADLSSGSASGFLITLVVKLAGSGSVIPLSFKVNV